MTVTSKEEILLFINNFKKNYTSGLEICFTNGLCYWFAVILKERFNGAKIFYDPINGHFITEIGGSFYDITGEVLIKNKQSLIDGDCYNDSIHKEHIIKNCINFN